MLDQFWPVIWCLLDSMAAAMETRQPEEREEQDNEILVRVHHAQFRSLRSESILCHWMSFHS